MAVMKGRMMIFAIPCLLVCWILPVDSRHILGNIRQQDAKTRVPLSMMEDSVDDMYFSCNETMNTKVKEKYLDEEMNHYKNTWDEAVKWANKKLPVTYKTDKDLTSDHLQALYLYTSDEVYNDFNKAVREEGDNYTSSFHFHSLHYLLTSAIQILNNNKFCHTSYRRTTVQFTGDVNQIIRFGSFASSSYRTDLTDFGSETCFEIETCYGAFLKNYTYYPSEKEVLIPPYEMFKITKKITKNKYQALSNPDLRDCEVLYALKSVGLKSNLNCKLGR